MKKILSVSLALVMLLAISTQFGFSKAEAKVGNKEIVFQAKEIKDKETLYKRALKGINEDKKGAPVPEKAVLKGNGDSVEIETKTTSQLLERYNKEDGTSVEVYAATTFTEVEGEDLVAASASGQSGSTWDSSGGIKAFSTIYYERPSYDGNYYIEIKYATGGWDFYDGNLRVLNRDVRIGASGPTAWGGSARAVDQRRNYYGVGLDWTAYAYASWVPVLDNGRTSSGIASYSTISGYGDSWTLNHYNNR
jgi:hypothetical protein